MKRLIALVSVVTCLAGLTSCQTKPKTAEGKSLDEESKVPKLKKPVVRRIWVPEKIEENGLIWEEGHWRYEVEKNATFAR